jgi:hypothetical protein
MTRAYQATFTGFTGAQFVCPIIAESLAEARAIAEDHMCAGDLLTIETTREDLN